MKEAYNNILQDLRLKDIVYNSRYMRMLSELFEKIRIKYRN